MNEPFSHVGVFLHFSFSNTQYDLVLPEGAVVLQYADDLLISAETADICKEATWSLLNRLAQRGFNVSLSKLPFCETEVKCLGFILTQGNSSKDFRPAALFSNVHLTGTAGQFPARPGEGAGRLVFPVLCLCNKSSASLNPAYGSLSTACRRNDVPTTEVRIPALHRAGVPGRD
ncbi:hypothetical protein QTP86_000794 [Hemibagrus guttatus]|nr:hypothetical protein QTP86_000794 [Hemibagrus guttatus]